MQPAVPLRIGPMLPNRSVERVESLEVSVILHIFGSTSNSATMKHTKRSTRETCSLYASLKYRWARIKRRYYICMKEPVALTRLLYRMTFGHDPDLERPQTYNEKVLWLKLFTDTSLWTLLADKYRVREYVRQRIGRGGESLLNELYAVWDSAAEIDLDSLRNSDGERPSSVVLKTNNGCGDVLIVRDIDTADLSAIRRKMHRALHRRFGRKTAEYHYLAIRPCILAERLLPGDPIHGGAPVDYKFYCFGGVPRYCLVCYDRRAAGNVKTGLYDAHTWENLGHYVTGPYQDPEQHVFPRPRSLKRMLRIAARLSAGFPTVRVDFYEIDGAPIFGEMTFTSAAGLDTGFTEEFQRIMGSLVELPARTEE